MSSLANASNSVRAVTDVYTDLHGMQQLSSEKDSSQALKKVAQQFESMFINMMMKNMRQANAVFEEGNMFDSQESRFYRDMYDQQLSLSMAHKENGTGKGIGIADALYRQMSRNYLGNEEQPELGSSNPLVAQGEVNSNDSKNDSFIDRRLTDSNPYSHLQTEDSTYLNLSDIHPNSSFSNQLASKTPIAESPEEFVALLLPMAQNAAKRLGVDEKVLLAQSALETGWGAKVLSDSHGDSTHNLFNIKVGSNWFGEAVDLNASEVHKGEWINEPSQFRQYPSIEKSFDDYVDFISNSERYSSAVNLAESHLSKNNNEERARAYIENIHQAGYATDPKYTEKVMAVYQRIENILENTSGFNRIQNNVNDQFTHQVGDRIKQTISTFNKILK